MDKCRTQLGSVVSPEHFYSWTQFAHSDPVAAGLIAAPPGVQTAQTQNAAQAKQAQDQSMVTPRAPVVPYDTHGATAFDAITDAETNGPNKPFVGSTNPGNVSVTSGVECFGGLCTAYVSTIQFSQITISAPQWAEYAQASASEQSAWDSYVSGLFRHENGHVKDALDIQVKEGAALGRVGATGNSAERAIQNINNKIRAVEEQYGSLFREWSSSYDQRTCHGECQ